MPFIGQPKIVWKDCADLEEGILKPIDLPKNVIPTNKEVYNAYLHFGTGANDIDALAENMINQVIFCFNFRMYI
jgi:hypothetical protein